MNLPERLENGRLPAFCFPGGYPIFYICADNGILCPNCANQDNGSLAFTNDGHCGAIEDSEFVDKQWCIVAYDVNYENDNAYCDHCGVRIESAYGDE